MIENVNIWAILVAAISAFVLGGIWYSPVLFCKLWLQESGIDVEKCKQKHGAKIFVIAFLLTLIAATVFAVFLGPNPELGFAVKAGLAVGLGWVATSFGVNYLFANKSLKLFLIDSGYHALQFILFGIILGLWH